MHNILFVCTANIFRSRFSEEVYNHLTKERNLPTQAFSAGLMVGQYTLRKIYYPALDQLQKFNISPLRKDELSVHINNLDLSEYDKVICMDEDEHRPMVESNPRLKKLDIEYWNIVDEPEVSSHISLPKCYKNVKELVSKVGLELV